MRPVIGLTLSLQEDKRMTLHRDNSDAIYRAGGLPMLLPATLDEGALWDLVTQVDGLLLTGGGDIDPVLFGEEPLPGLGKVEPERDRMEIILVRFMVKASKPILAICRGCQILAVALGGNMYQDLAHQREGLLQHAQLAPRDHPAHGVEVMEGTLLHRITGWGTGRVNSFHHQAVRDIPETCRVSAVAPDGVVEAFEGVSTSFLLGLQWHPENTAATDSVSQEIFNAFVRACAGESQKVQT
ncbi:gamma-glutamyl-gamma-aminobutyrate hydrolase family protein [Salinithrix halophila]|uniref:Gamma-glutamyl-gamma-aminobutyrate hydrolase family protein n=1 Tax=Salinithrix halophila TaxID=1485204 RepID=A0ABV8JDD5_9BACL